MSIKELIVWNGMSSVQLSGGDNYTINLINLTNKDQVDQKIILPDISRQFVHDKRKILHAIKGVAPGSFLDLIKVYNARKRQAVKILREKDERFDIGLASSPFLFDTIPVAKSNSKAKGCIFFHTLPKREAKSISTAIRFLIADVERRLSFRVIEKHFDFIIAGNELVKDDLQKRFPHKKIFVSDAGIDTKALDEAKDVEKDPFSGCFVGRLVSQKGILDLVDIMKRINKAHPEFKLTIVGDGPEKQLLMDEIKKENVDSIRLLGFVSEEEKNQVLKRSKFFFFPSKEEGWGISLAEALYSEAICVCYDLPHYKGIFEDYPIYIKNNSKEEFARQIMESYHQQPSEQQKEFVGKYDYENIVKKLNLTLMRMSSG